MRDKKKILIIMPYANIYPPKSGGMLRCFNLFLQYVKYFDVTAVFLQDKNSFIDSSAFYPSVKNAKLFSSKGVTPGKDFFSLLPRRIGDALRYRWIIRSFKARADGSFLALYPLLIELLSQENFDGIVLENLSLTTQSSFFRRMNPKAKIIFNSYNVDSILARQAYEKGAGSLKEVNEIHLQEAGLDKKIDILLCCSENDSNQFSVLNNGKLKNILVIPNGVDIDKAAYRDNLTDRIMQNVLFCGSLEYEPNREGLLWFYRKVWPLVLGKRKEMKLNVVGRGDKSPYAELMADPSVNFIGEVDDLTSYYHSSYISIAPLMQGSGTRLKILEAMSYGTPVVSTAIGAEGIHCEHEKHILIADSEELFAEAVLKLIDSKETGELLSRNARKLVEEIYSWEAIGKGLKEVLNRE
jgi:glycosyltransferase involved in cell wall biosynthesis